MKATAVIAALGYAARGWPVFPVSVEKRPLTKHGLCDGTQDEAQIRSWWKQWPAALIAIVTGERSGIVALDIDISDKANGWDTLEEIGIHLSPVTPLAQTPRGGTHCLFAWRGCFVKTVAGRLGPGLDIRGDGGSLILPPGPDRSWDPHLGPDTPLAPMPTWMVILEPERRQESRPAARSAVQFSRYAEAALDSAVKGITSASAGAQRDTLNRECFAIGGLVASGVIPSALALEALTWAALQMTSYDLHRRWRPAEVERMVRDAFLDGLRHPRAVSA